MDALEKRSVAPILGALALCASIYVAASAVLALLIAPSGEDFISSWWLLFGGVAGVKNYCKEFPATVLDFVILIASVAVVTLSLVLSIRARSRWKWLVVIACAVAWSFSGYFVATQFV